MNLSEFSLSALVIDKFNGSIQLDQNPFSGLIIWIYSIYAGTNWCQRTKSSHYQNPNPKVEIDQAADCENKDFAFTSSSQTQF